MVTNCNGRKTVINWQKGEVKPNAKEHTQNIKSTYLAQANFSLLFNLKRR